MNSNRFDVTDHDFEMANEGILRKNVLLSIVAIILPNLLKEYGKCDDAEKVLHSLSKDPVFIAGMLTALKVWLLQDAPAYISRESTGCKILRGWLPDIMKYYHE